MRTVATALLVLAAVVFVATLHRGGFLGYVIFGKDVSKGAFQTSGLLGSIVGAVLVLLVYRRVAKQP